MSVVLEVRSLRFGVILIHSKKLHLLFIFHLTYILALPYLYNYIVSRAHILTSRYIPLSLSSSLPNRAKSASDIKPVLSLQQLRMPAMSRLRTFMNTNEPFRNCTWSFFWILWTFFRWSLINMRDYYFHLYFVISAVFNCKACIYRGKMVYMIWMPVLVVWIEA